jgi:protein SCO1
MRLTLLVCLILAGCSRQATLPVLNQVPPFTLTTQDGRPFSSAELQGKVWVGDLIFTSCPDVCPRMSTLMTKLQGQTKDLRLVTFTVDPDRDTPVALASYAKRYQANPARWTFLTGAVDELNKVSQAFLFGKIHLEHTSRFVLVDQLSRVRAFYATDEPDALERLTRDAALLQGE